MHFVMSDCQIICIDTHPWLTAVLCGASISLVQFELLYLAHTRFDDLWACMQRCCCCVQEGAVFKGKYSMQSHGWPGPAYVLCSGHSSALPHQHLSVKLFARGVDYLQEKALLETPTITLQEYLPGL